jgi:triosephosphate isomerase (TIM)
MPKKIKKRKIIVANWKMNPLTLEEAKRTFLGIKKAAEKCERVDTIVCAPFVYISPLRKLFNSDYIALGAQNVFHEQGGAFTGEVGPGMLKDIGAEAVIIGHSERRARGETDEMVAEKVAAALKAGLKVVLCVGEKVRDEHVMYLDFIKDQIRNSLAKTQRPMLKNLIVAYEPVWAIGKKDNEAMTPGSLHEMTIYIKKILSDLYGQEYGKSTPILYGGSVTVRNAKDIVVGGEVDGLLVGRESLNPSAFGEILKMNDDK